MFRLLHEFCAVQISAVYGNAMKDRLYCEAPDSPLRRRCQTVMHRMAVALTKLLAPMLVFTADEAWEHIAAQAGGGRRARQRPPGAAARAVRARSRATSSSEEWQLLMELRDAALLQLDALKKEAGHEQGAGRGGRSTTSTTTTCAGGCRRTARTWRTSSAPGFHTFAEKAHRGPGGDGEGGRPARERTRACARSWKRRPDVGQDPEYPDLTSATPPPLRAAKVRSRSGDASPSARTQGEVQG